MALIFAVNFCRTQAVLISTAADRQGHLLVFAVATPTDTHGMGHVCFVVVAPNVARWVHFFHESVIAALFLSHFTLNFSAGH